MQNQKNVRNLTTLCYIEKDDCYLMLHRISKKNDINKDKWIGVGGHFELNESPEECLLREVKEETGLLIENPKLCGVKQFKISKTGERFICLFFKTDKFTGKLSSSDEGEVFWIKRTDLENYVLADGFGDMVKVFENDELSEIYYGRICKRRGRSY